MKMDEHYTRPIKASDFNKIKKIDYLLNLDEDNIIKYLRITKEDNRYLVYIKKEDIWFNKVITGCTINFFVYDLERKEFLTDIHIAEANVEVDKDIDEIAIRAYVHKRIPEDHIFYFTPRLFK